MNERLPAVPTPDDIAEKVDEWGLRVWEFARQRGVKRVTADVRLHEGFRATVRFDTTPDGAVVWSFRRFGIGPRDRRVVVTADGRLAETHDSDASAGGT